MNDPELIEREIELTRERIDCKAAELKTSLTPPSITHIKDTLSGGGRKILESFRENPVPIALMGAGLGWLMIRDATAYRNHGQPVYKPEAAMSAGHIKDAMHKAGEKVAEGVSSVKDTAVRGARKASDWFNATLEENPLVLAVATLGLGLIAGLALPVSQAEKDTAGKLGEKIATAVLEKSATALEKTEEPASSNTDPAGL